MHPLMSKKKGKQKSTESTKAVDVFEAWIEKQKAKPVTARPGFISGED